MSRFRPEYRKLSKAEAAFVARVKEDAEELEASMAAAYTHRHRDDETQPHMGAPFSREHALALSRLEESVMWAVKGLTL